MKEPLLVKMNGNYFPSDIDLIEGSILSCIEDLKYWSPRSLMRLRNGLSEMVIELATELLQDSKGGDITKLKRVITSRKKYLEFKPYLPNILTHLYEKILEMESCGRLRGFGFCSRFKDPIRGNPEYHSVTKDTGW